MTDRQSIEIVEEGIIKIRDDYQPIDEAEAEAREVLRVIAEHRGRGEADKSIYDGEINITADDK